MTTPRLTKNARALIGDTVEITWGTSRGRDTYGYTTATLRHNGRKIADCNGGGYDMAGTVIGDFIARTLPAELRAIKPEAMPERSHWQRADKPRRFCCNLACEDAAGNHGGAKRGLYEMHAPEADCPCEICGGPTRPDYNDGERVSEGRAFYGLTFHDPNYDAGKAIIGKDCADRTLARGSTGTTVEDAEKAGASLGLERYQATYKASSPHSTKRHTVPSIDGACGVSCVLDILRACGLTMHKIADTKRLDVWQINALPKAPRKRTKRSTETANA